jgi:hypothetical protein
LLEILMQYFVVSERMKSTFKLMISQHGRCWKQTRSLERAYWCGGRQRSLEHEDDLSWTDAIGALRRRAEQRRGRRELRTAAERKGAAQGGGRPSGSSTTPPLLEGLPPLLEALPPLLKAAAGLRGREPRSGASPAPAELRRETSNGDSAPPVCDFELRTTGEKKCSWEGVFAKFLFNGLGCWGAI